MEITAISTQDTKKLATEIAKVIKPNDVIALYGDLGSGKTTFTNYLVEALGIQARVQSPTFVLARKYVSRDDTLPITTVNHVDLYRLTTDEEVVDLGLNELFNEKKSITVIEWPETAKKLLPENTISIYFSTVDECTRKIDVQNIH